MRSLFAIAWVFISALATAQTEQSTARNVVAVPYYPADQKIEDPDQRCKVDLRLPPDGSKGFATLVWFHGGGMTAGNREFPQFAGQKVALVAAGYRLSPQVPCPVFIEDAAASIAWTIQHIADYGGDPKKVFIGGHSAGAYLAMMVGMDPQWLKPHGLMPQAIAGIVPVSGQVTTHFHVKELRGFMGDPLVPVIDEYAPLHFASKTLPPLCLITGDRRIEFKSRVEENDLFYVTLKNLGHPKVEFHEIPDLDHNTVTKGAATILADFVQRLAGEATRDP
jgi:acetyl esterase/lipase